MHHLSDPGTALIGSDTTSSKQKAMQQKSKIPGKGGKSINLKTPQSVKADPHDRINATGAGEWLHFSQDGSAIARPSRRGNKRCNGRGAASLMATIRNLS